MSTKKFALPAAALFAILTAATGLAPLADAQAQGTAPEATSPQGTVQGTAPQHAPRHMNRERARLPGEHVEGRIAYLKAELKITPAQEAQWDKVAAAMRDNAKTMDQAIQQMRGQRGQAQNAADRLEARARFAGLRAQNDQRLADAFKPLYASLSDSQKQAADGILAHPHGHGHHGGRR